MFGRLSNLCVWICLYFGSEIVHKRLWLIVAEHETLAEYQFAYSRSALKVCAGDGKVHHFERGKSPHPDVAS